jgi:hypothetical protein
VYPQILEKVRRGELHLSGINLLGPKLTPANCDELLRVATHKSKREIECLLADREPRRDAPSRVRRLPTRREELPPPQRVLTPQPRRSEIQEPLGNQRFKVQFTACAELTDKIEEAKALLRHSVPSGDLAEIVSRALSLLIEGEKKRRFGLTERPRKPKAQSSGRPIPAAVRRRVYERDGGRCAYMSSGGRHCDSRDFLQYHHEDNWSVHGRHDPDRITLRCHAHNQLAAEQDFGRDFMHRRRRNSSREELLV